VPGYGQPTCNKCTGQLATKTLVSSFYRNHHHHHHNHHRNNNNSSSSSNITGSGGGGGGGSGGVSSGGVIGLVGVGSSSGLGLIEQMQQTENQANITNVIN